MQTPHTAPLQPPAVSLCLQGDLTAAAAPCKGCVRLQQQVEALQASVGDITQQRNNETTARVGAEQQLVSSVCVGRGVGVRVGARLSTVLAHYG